MNNDLTKLASFSLGVWWYVLFWCILFTTLSTPSISQSQGDFRVELEPDFIHVPSAAWSHDGNILYVVGAFRREIYPVAITRDQGPAIPISGIISDETFTKGNLGILQQASDGFVLQGHVAKMLYLNRSFEPQGIADLVDGAALSEASSTVEEDLMGAVFSWAITDGTFYMFSDIKTQFPDWLAGFFMASFDSPEDFKPFLGYGLSTSDPMKTFYRLDLGMFATTTSGKVYILVMDLDPRLVEINKGAYREIKIFADDCKRHPITSLNRLTAFQTLERTRGVEGVYTHGESVYLLCRDFIGKKLRFKLHRIDTDTGASTASVTLDTDAKHLVIVPGPKYWAFVEKGPAAEVSLNEFSYARAPAKTVWFFPAANLAQVMGQRATINGHVKSATDTASLESWISMNRDWLFSGAAMKVICIAVSLIFAMFIFIGYRLRPEWGVWTILDAVRRREFLIPRRWRSKQDEIDSGGDG